METGGNRATHVWVALMKMGALTGCHQKYDRSFNLNGFQFPLCARCTGLFAGQLLAFAAFACAPFRRLRARLLAAPAAAAITALGIDGTGQLKGFWVSNNKRRFITGLFAGFFTAAVVVKAYITLLRKLRNLLPK